MFLDPDKLHALDHDGEHFPVAGPLNISRSPQGQPVIFQAGVSERGPRPRAPGRRGHLRAGRLARAGPGVLRRHQAARRRPRPRPRPHQDLHPRRPGRRGDTDEAARRRDREIYEEDNDFDRNLALLGRSFGAHDFSQYDLDAPFPDVAHLAETGGRTAAAKLIERARASNLTLRQVVEADQRVPPVARSSATPETVADTIEQWFAAGTFDGINLAFRTTDELELFVDGVVPILQARGLFRTEYEADTLRGNLGLPIPANRYAREHELASV